MTTMKAGLAGAALGALIWATVMFVAPISAQSPGAQAPGTQAPGAQAPGAPTPGMQAPGAPTPGMQAPSGDTVSRGRPGMTGRDSGPGATGSGRMGPGMMGRSAPDANDDDITGPRGNNGLCQERFAQMAELRLEHIQRLVRPTDEQRLALEELKAAAAKAVDIARAACPPERPLSPPARLAAAERLIEARLQALRTIRPALESFYKILSDEQKIRWANGLGGFGAYDHGRDGRGGWGRDDGGRYGRDGRRDDGPEWGGSRGRGWEGFGGRGPERWRDRGHDEDGGGWGRWREEREGYDRFRGHGEDWGYRGRDDDRHRFGAERRRSDDWRERGRDWHDRYGFDGGGGRDSDAWDQRWHEDERGGSDRRSGRDERERSRPRQPEEERL
jgi:hypothetical protein